MRPIKVHTRHFPFGNYHAITLFPFIVYKGGPLTQRTVRHETVHLWQQAVLLVVVFYLLYVAFWLVGLLRYRSQDKAYRSIPFERSAYSLETESTTSWYTMAFDWLHHLRS